MNKKEFDKLLCGLIKDNVTEYYLTPGAKPFCRVAGKLIISDDDDEVTVEYTEKLMDELLIDRERIQYQQVGDIEIPYAISGVGRLRIHFGKQRSSVTITIHIKNATIPDIEFLKIPRSVVEIFQKESGLLLITGSKKSGKSTTAASLIQHICKNKPKFVASVEQPIQYLLNHGKGIVNQREVGIDVETMSKGLQDAIDDYADIIYISNLSDSHIIERMYEALERGYFVIACMYSDSVESALTKLQFAMGNNYQCRCKLILARHLRGIVCQQLLSGAEAALEPVFEVLVANQSVRKMLEENKLGQLRAIFDSQRNIGTIEMDQALIEAYQEERISLQTAVNASHNSKELQKTLTKVGV